MSPRNRFLAFLALAFVAAASAQETQAWRKPDGGLYYGIAPPPGSVRIQATEKRRPSPRAEAPAELKPAVPTPRPTRPEPSPTAVPTATRPPSPRPTIAPPTATPTARPEPTIRPAPMRSPHHEPTATPTRETAAGTECGEYVAIRDTRATIDGETDRAKMVGEVVVAGASVRELTVCMGESCVLVAGGKLMANGESARFSVAAHGRPGAFTVRCSVVH